MKLVQTDRVSVNGRRGLSVVHPEGVKITAPVEGETSSLNISSFEGLVIRPLGEDRTVEYGPSTWETVTVSTTPRAYPGLRVVVHEDDADVNFPAAHVAVKQGGRWFRLTWGDNGAIAMIPAKGADLP